MKRWVQLVCAAAAAVMILGGCSYSGMLKEETGHLPDTEQISESEKESTPTDFISGYRDIALTLPAGWRVTHDQKALCSFQSDAGDTMTIAYTEGYARVTVLSFPGTRQEAAEMLNKIGYGEDACEIIDFQSQTFLEGQEKQTDFYEFKVRKTGAGYSLYIGIKMEDQAYQITISVDSDRETVLDEMKTALDSMEFLDYEGLTAMFQAGIDPETEAPSEADLGSVNEGSVICKSPVNVRTAPSTHGSQVIGSLSAGDEILVTGEEGNWYQFEYEGQTAYAYKEYFEEKK